MGSRLTSFTSVFGENWHVGRYLLPLLRSFGAGMNGVVLDLACGESPFRGYFPSARRYLRVDRLPCDPEVMDGDMRTIPLPANCVDLVILSQALTDVPMPIEVLNELARILVPGGQVLVFESMAYPEHDMPYDYYRLMPSGLSQLAEDAGFDTQELIYLGGLFTRFSQLWASYIMGALKQFAILRPVAALGIAAGNIVCHGLDRVVARPRLASDYLAILRLR